MAVARTGEGVVTRATLEQRVRGSAPFQTTPVGFARFLVSQPGWEKKSSAFLRFVDLILDEYGKLLLESGDWETDAVEDFLFEAKNVTRVLRKYDSGGSTRIEELDDDDDLDASGGWGRTIFNTVMFIWIVTMLYEIYNIFYVGAAVEEFYEADATYVGLLRNTITEGVQNTTAAVQEVVADTPTGRQAIVAFDQLRGGVTETFQQMLPGVGQNAIAIWDSAGEMLRQYTSYDQVDWVLSNVVGRVDTHVQSNPWTVTQSVFGGRPSEYLPLDTLQVALQRLETLNPALADARDNLASARVQYNREIASNTAELYALRIGLRVFQAAPVVGGAVRAAYSSIKSRFWGSAEETDLGDLGVPGSVSEAELEDLGNAALASAYIDSQLQTPPGSPRMQRRRSLSSSQMEDDRAIKEALVAARGDVKKAAARLLL